MLLMQPHKHEGRITPILKTQKPLVSINICAFAQFIFSGRSADAGPLAFVSGWQLLFAVPGSIYANLRLHCGRLGPEFRPPRPTLSRETPRQTVRAWLSSTRKLKGRGVAGHEFG